MCSCILIGTDGRYQQALVIFNNNNNIIEGGEVGKRFGKINQFMAFIMFYLGYVCDNDRGVVARGVGQLFAFCSSARHTFSWLCWLARGIQELKGQYFTIICVRGRCADNLIILLQSFWIEYRMWWVLISFIARIVCLSSEGTLIMCLPKANILPFPPINQYSRGSYFFFKYLPPK